MKQTTRRAAAKSGAEYRKMLMEKRQNLLKGLGVKFDALAKMGQIAEDDQAQISHDEFVSLQLNSLDYAQLRLVEEALDRLETGHYGICVNCGEPIPAKRLQAIPWAKRCVRCQERRAADEEQTGRAAAEE